MSLREAVTITTPGSELAGHLFVGADGLPELTVEYDHPSQVGIQAYTGPLRYRPAQLPATWIVTSPTCGTLYSAWDLIWNLIEEIAIAQREAEVEDKEDICGLCGEVGADKFPHPVYWPDEKRPGTKLVHADCENAECKRASDLITGQRREDFLRNL